MNYAGPGKLKSNPSSFNISDSILINYYLFTYYFSSEGNNLIILEKLGLIGYSSLADINTEITARWRMYWGSNLSSPFIIR